MLEANLERRRWRVLLVTSIGAFMAPLDGSIVAVALPKMGEELRLSFTAATWVPTAYLLALTVTLIPAGRISDTAGRLRTYRLGVLAFTLASVVTGMAQFPSWLLGARALQGAAASLIAATGAALITEVFPSDERGRALGINVMSVYLGLVTGPILGGVLTDRLGWRSIFFVNLPVGIATLIAAIGLREDVPRARSRALDPTGLVLLAAGISTALVGLTFAPVWGWSSPSALGLLAAGGIALVAFPLVESRARHPVIDLGMFRGNARFSAGNLAALLCYTALFAITVLTSVLLEVVGGRSAEATGLLLVAQPAVMVVLSPFTGWLSDRIGSRLPATGGLLLIAVGMLLLARVSPGLYTGHILGALAVVGVGMALFSSPNTSDVMGAVGRAHLGTASAVLGTMRFLGQALSVAILGAVAAASLGPSGGSILLTAHGGAADAAAYLSGYHRAMAIGVGIALAAVMVSALRGRPRPAVT